MNLIPSDYKLPHFGEGHPVWSFNRQYFQLYS